MYSCVVQATIAKRLFFFVFIKLLWSQVNELLLLKSKNNGDNAKTFRRLRVLDVIHKLIKIKVVYKNEEIKQKFYEMRISFVLLSMGCKDGIIEQAFTIGHNINVPLQIIFSIKEQNLHSNGQTTTEFIEKTNKQVEL